MAVEFLNLKLLFFFKQLDFVIEVFVWLQSLRKYLLLGRIMDVEDSLVLRTVCYAGQLQFVEVPKSSDKGEVSYKDLLESGEYHDEFSNSFSSLFQSFWTRMSFWLIYGVVFDVLGKLLRIKHNLFL